MIRIAAANARGQAPGGPRLAEARAIYHARLKAGAEAHADAVMPMIREAQAAGAAADRGCAQRARNRHGAGGKWEAQARPTPSASLMQTRRVAGKVRSEHIASLGSVDADVSVRERLAFWAKLPERLARLGNRVGPDDQAKIYGALHARIPMVTPDEQRAIQEENARTTSGSGTDAGPQRFAYRGPQGAHRTGRGEDRRDGAGSGQSG